MSSLLANFQEVIDPDGVEAKRILQLDPDKIPRHIAIIMDGNGRWARKRNRPRVEGHRSGITAVKSVIEYAARLEVSVLTLYAFSVENWKRPRVEVSTLWNLLKEYLIKELGNIVDKDICFQAIGRTEELPLGVLRQLRYVEKETARNQGMKLVVALNYSGRAELLDAFNSLLRQGVSSPVTERDIHAHLYTKDLPEPDLLIRTSGEMRISNFLLWQIAYAEIYVTDILWPDFRGRHLLDAMIDFQSRERRYGGVRAVSR